MVTEQYRITGDFSTAFYLLLKKNCAPALAGHRAAILFNRNLRRDDSMIVPYKPKLEDLWFREEFMNDPETMSYNIAWGGTIPFPKEEWRDWYDRWIVHDDGNQRYYRYLLDKDRNEFVGEIAYHLDSEKNIYLANIIIYSKYRGKSYGKRGLNLLCQAAKENGCIELYDDIAADNPSVQLFLNMGFVVDYATEEVVMMKKVL
ncbi:GNAT family N-acetyltransferase [Roseburia hominis]